MKQEKLKGLFFYLDWLLSVQYDESLQCLPLVVSFFSRVNLLTIDPFDTN